MPAALPDRHIDGANQGPDGWLAGQLAGLAAANDVARRKARALCAFEGHLTDAFAGLVAPRSP